MDDVVLARHGESVTTAARIVGGDAPLTPRGRDQARQLGVELASHSFDVCVTSGALRADETATIALGDRRVPREVDVRFGDIDFGDFAGGPLDEYRAWIGTHRPADAPSGGESRVTTLRRFVQAYTSLLERAESHVLVVAHGLTLSALVDDPPKPEVAGVAYGSWLRFTAAELASRVAHLELWCEAPHW